MTPKIYSKGGNLALDDQNQGIYQSHYDLTGEEQSKKLLKKLHEDKMERKRQMEIRRKAEIEKYEKLEQERNSKDAELKSKLEAEKR